MSSAAESPRYMVLITPVLIKGITTAPSRGLEMRLVRGSGGIVLLSGYRCDSGMQWIIHLWLCLLIRNYFNLQLVNHLSSE